MNNFFRTNVDEQVCIPSCCHGRRSFLSVLSEGRRARLIFCRKPYVWRLAFSYAITTTTKWLRPRQSTSLCRNLTPVALYSSEFQHQIRLCSLRRFDIEYIISICRVVDLQNLIVLIILNKKAQLTLSNPRDVKACQNCSNSTCFVSFHRISFPQIANA